MGSKKVFFALLGLLGLVVACSVAGTVYGTKMLKQTGSTLMERKLEEAVLEKDSDALTQAKLDIDKYEQLGQIAQAIVPQEKDQARTVRELVNLASQSGVVIESISFPESTLGEKPKKAKKGSKTTEAPAGTTQLTPVEGLSGVFAMPIDIALSDTSSLTYDQVLGFLKRLEQNRRTSHVTNISIQPNPEDRNLVTFTMQINAYIKP